MATAVVDIIDESRTRYLTYALSVVTSRAIPDVRDGLKPVQRRIIYAMYKNLGLLPNKSFRKSAAVVGEVLGRYHPHGDSACYEAMVRMAQDFSLRYPLVEGQGNFGSLDGDGAAAYRYTEARLEAIAIELLGDIESETVSFRENFDQTTQEPTVLPSRIPNLLMNGASGIAVGMATSIPPHNLSELCDAAKKMILKPKISEEAIFELIQGPDFPTACEIVSSPEDIAAIYRVGKGSIKMRATYRIELLKNKGTKVTKKAIIFDSIPYGVDKSTLVEKLADIVISKKLTQIEDIRDESTEEVRIVIELNETADEDLLLAYFFKSTPLEMNFSMNFTVLAPDAETGQSVPKVLSLKQILEHFCEFRLEVVRKKLEHELRLLEQRIHLLQGLQSILDVLDQVIKEVRASAGRKDAVGRLQKKFKLSELQAEFIVDLRIYQLTQTSLDDVLGELGEKEKRVSQINKILSDETLLRKQVALDIDRIKAEFGDKRRSKIVAVDHSVVSISESDLIENETVFAIVTKDAWLKRIKAANDPNTTRVRDGDSIFRSFVAQTKDQLMLFTSFGNCYSINIHELSTSSGYGEPMQKLFKCADGEIVKESLVFSEADAEDHEVLLYTEQGIGYRAKLKDCISQKKTGRRVMKLKGGDSLCGVSVLTHSKKSPLAAFISRKGYCLLVMGSELPSLNVGAKGVQLMKQTGGDTLVAACWLDKKQSIECVHTKGICEINPSSFTLGKRAQRGDKIPKKRIGEIISAKVLQKIQK